VASFLFHDHLWSLTFAGMEDNGLMSGGLIGGAAAAMGVAMEVELALAEFGPQQARRSHSHDYQRRHCLPVRIHSTNIGGPAWLAMRFFPRSSDALSPSGDSAAAACFGSGSATRASPLLPR